MPRGSLALWAILAAELLILTLPATWWAVAGGVLVGLVFLGVLVLLILGGEGGPIIVAWALTFPLGYHFVAFPKEQAIITLDRSALALALATICFAKRDGLRRLPSLLSKSAGYWGFFLVLAGLSIPWSKSPLAALHIWMDALVFPALMAWYVLRYFDVHRYSRALHAAICVMVMYTAAIGAAEVATLTDLLPVTGGGIYLAGGGEGSASQFLMRPNGPFSTDHAFALTGMVSFFLLLFLRREIGESVPRWQRILHRFGVSAALIQSLLPLFRSVMISFVVVLIVNAIYQRGRSRVLRFAVILSFGFAFLLMRIALPQVFEERTSSFNFYGRIAEYKQTLAMFADHPLTGVGFNNFADAAQSSKYVTYYQESESVDSPHSNLGGILAETGLIGLVPFVMSQVFLVYAFWKLQRSGSRELDLVWKTFLFMFLSYWVNGLTLTIIYSPDINIWYLFALGVLYKFAITSRDVRNLQPHELDRLFYPTSRLRGAAG